MMIRYYSSVCSVSESEPNTPLKMGIKIGSPDGLPINKSIMLFIDSNYF